MEQTKKKLFIRLQFLLLLGALTVLPSFDIIAIATGYAGMAVTLTQLIAAIWGIITLFKIIQNKDEATNPTTMVTCAGIGFLLVLLSPFFLPLWCDYVSMALLFIAMFLNKNALNIRWNSIGSQGAFFILMALLLRFYQHIDDTICTGIAALIGLILYYIGLGKITSAMDNQGIAALSKLKIAFIIGLISVIIDFIPLLGWLAVILAVVAFIFELLGYGSLKRTAAIGELGRKGAGKLQISMILMIIGSLLGLIPLAGDLIEGIITLIVIYLIFNGWKNILLGIENRNEQIA